MQKRTPRIACHNQGQPHRQKPMSFDGGLWKGCSHLSEVTLQPAYWAPRLLLLNNRLSWRGRREPVLVKGGQQSL